MQIDIGTREKEIAAILEWQALKLNHLRECCKNIPEDLKETCETTLISKRGRGRGNVVDIRDCHKISNYLTVITRLKIETIETNSLWKAGQIQVALINKYDRRLKMHARKISGSLPIGVLGLSEDDIEAELKVARVERSLIQFDISKPGEKKIEQSFWLNGSAYYEELKDKIFTKQSTPFITPETEDRSEQYFAKLSDKPTNKTDIIRHWIKSLKSRKWETTRLKEYYEEFQEDKGEIPKSVFVQEMKHFFAYKGLQRKFESYTRKNCVTQTNNSSVDGTTLLSELLPLCKTESQKAYLQWKAGQISSDFFEEELIEGETEESVRRELEKLISGKSFGVGENIYKTPSPEVRTSLAVIGMPLRLIECLKGVDIRDLETLKSTKNLSGLIGKSLSNQVLKYLS